MSQGTRAVFVELQSVDATTLTSASDWVLVGILPHSIRNMFVDNLSDQDVQLSVDNFDPAYGGNINSQAFTQGIYDISSNKTETKSERSEEPRLNSSHIPLSRMPSSA